MTYPQTERIRKRWVLRQVVKLIIFTGLMGFIAEQVCTLYTLYICILLKGAMPLCQYLIKLLRHAVYQSYNKELSASIERELPLCN